MAKPADLPPLSDAQLEIMNVIWDRGEATVGEVWKVLSGRRPLARNTVLTMISRLEDKGWLRHRAQSNTFRYRAAVPREATLTRLVQRLVDLGFQGSAEGLVMTLLQSCRLADGEAERIRAMLEECGRQSEEERR